MPLVPQGLSGSHHKPRNTRTIPQSASGQTRRFQALASWLFQPRALPPLRAFEPGDLLVLALYTAVLAFAIAQHVPWADEAQAWLLARDSSLHNLLFRRLHYEGAPALWPLLLWSAIRLHLPYAALNWFSGALALPGIVVLLRYAPFPRLVRWLLPFTFFLQYQYAVIARPYILSPLLVFAVCLAFSARRPRPLLFALCAGLLANVGLHAAVVACLFALLFLFRLLRPAAATPKSVPSTVPSTVPRSFPKSVTRSVPLDRIGIAAALFAILLACAVLVALPAPDISLPGLRSDVSQPARGWLQPEPQLPATVPLDPPLDAEATPPPPPLRPAALLFKSVLLSANSADFPIARSNLLALLFLAAFLLWLRSRGALLLAAPWLLAILLCVPIWTAEHHTGEFLLALIAAVWIALETTQPGQAVWPPRLFAAVSVLVLLLQIGWTAFCLRFEAHTRYDPGRETARFLLTHFRGQRVAAFGYDSVSITPWLTAPLFFNQPHAFWLWSTHTAINRRRTEVLLQHPGAIVVPDVSMGAELERNQWFPFVQPGNHPNAQMLQFWTGHGFHETHRFCGERPFRLGINYIACDLILEPEASAQTPARTAVSRGLARP